MIRDWTASENIDQLSPGAEVFFTRLIMKADDYGSFHTNPKLVRAALFPLKDYKDKQIIDWIAELTNCGIVFQYEADGKKFMRIVDFGQRLRNMRGAFPQPSDEDLQLAATRCECRPELEEKRREEEEELELEGNAADCGEVSVWPSFDDFWNVYDKKQDRPKCEKKWKDIKQGAREKIMQHLELYVRSTPDVKYRKNPLTYLNNQSWENEIITSKPTSGITAQGTLERFNSYTN